MLTKVIEEIKRSNCGTVHMNQSLKKYTTYKVGGLATIVSPYNEKELIRLVNILRKYRVKYKVLGNGSNVIFKDEPYDGILIHLDEFDTFYMEQNRVIVGAGYSLQRLALKVSRLGYSGLEFAAGIPGSIGGSVFMNAGAYGGEIKNIVESVKLLTRNGEYKTYTVDELDFGYRHSRLQSEDDIVVAATFKLEHGDIKKIRERMEELSFLRASKQPLEYPSCGSVFKRPAGHFTGKLVHDSGLQGYTVGGVQVSKKHAGFIVNIGNGTGKDYLDVIHHVQAVVKEKFDVELETEVRIIGED